MNRRQFITGSVAALATAALAKVAAALPQNETTKTNAMKIVVLTGSPRKNGNSNHLAEQFIKGARKAGHEVFRFDSAFQKVEG